MAERKRQGIPLVRPKKLSVQGVSPVVSMRQSGMTTASGEGSWTGAGSRGSPLPYDHAVACRPTRHGAIVSNVLLNGNKILFSIKEADMEENGKPGWTVSLDETKKEEARHSRKWEAVVTALSAVFGALVGGTLSFAGTYLTSESQAQRNDFHLRRTAYVEFFEAASDYRIQLIKLDRAVVSGNQSKFESALASMQEVENEFYGATTNVGLVTDSSNEAVAVYAEYAGVYIPSDNVEDFVLESLRGCVNRGDENLHKMSTKAQKDIKGEEYNEANPAPSGFAPSSG